MTVDQLLVLPTEKQRDILVSAMKSQTAAALTGTQRSIVENSNSPIFTLDIPACDTPVITSSKNSVPFMANSASSSTKTEMCLSPNPVI